MVSTAIPSIAGCREKNRIRPAGAKAIYARTESAYIFTKTHISHATHLAYRQDIVYIQTLE